MSGLAVAATPMKKNEGCSRSTALVAATHDFGALHQEKKYDRLAPGAVTKFHLLTSTCYMTVPHEVPLNT